MNLLIGNRSALKGLGIGIALSFLTQCTVSFCIVSYAVTTLAKAGTSMNPYTSSIVLAVALILGSLATTFIADKLGRKKSILFSLMASAVGLLTTATYRYLLLNGYVLSAFSWLPVSSLSLIVFSSTVGIEPLSVIVSAEYLPTKVSELKLNISLQFIDY